MKKIIYSFALITCAVVTACNSQSNTNEPATNMSHTPAGILIAADSMRIAEDQLNELYFTVKILTTENSDSGKYDILAAWGYNEARTTLAMPKGLEYAKPVLRKANEPYTYAVGFYLKDDTAFHDYYQVQAERGMIKAKYTRAYVFE